MTFWPKAVHMGSVNRKESDPFLPAAWTFWQRCQRVNISWHLLRKANLWRRKSIAFEIQDHDIAIEKKRVTRYHSLEESGMVRNFTTEQNTLLENSDDTTRWIMLPQHLHFVKPLHTLWEILSRYLGDKTPRIIPVDSCRRFPTELTPWGWPCCIVKILQECSLWGIVVVFRLF